MNGAAERVFAAPFSHAKPRAGIVCNMKIYVYAIARDEEKFAERWMTSMSEADGIYVLDTGSKDGTADKLRSLGAVVVREEFEPFRFDKARNRSLEFVPENADLCVCTDLDEEFTPGWRDAFERAASSGANAVKYRYVWNYLPDGKEGYVFWISKAHARRGFEWRHPVHEVVVPVSGGAKYAMADGVTLMHRPDPHKSRAGYLPLFELSVREDPTDDRNAHYLGREYMFHGRYEDAIAALKRHLELPTAVWRDERAASMRYIASCLSALGRRAEAEEWLMRACAEAPWLREPWLDAARQCLDGGMWHGAAYFAGRALAIERRSLSYINTPEAWGALPYDILSVALWNLGDREGAEEALKTALEHSPDDERLKQNLQYVSQNST